MSIFDINWMLMFVCESSNVIISDVMVTFECVIVHICIKLAVNGLNIYSLSVEVVI